MHLFVYQINAVCVFQKRRIAAGIERGSLWVYWSVKAGQRRPAEEERMICPLLTVGFLCALP